MHNTKIYTIFMNSKNSATSDTHRLLLNPTERINLKWSYKFVTLWNFSMFYTWENIKMSYETRRTIN